MKEVTGNQILKWSYVKEEVVGIKGDRDGDENGRRQCFHTAHDNYTCIVKSGLVYKTLR